MISEKRLQVEVDAQRGDVPTNGWYYGLLLSRENMCHCQGENTQARETWDHRRFHARACFGSVAATKHDQGGPDCGSQAVKVVGIVP